MGFYLQNTQKTHQVISGKIAIKVETYRFHLTLAHFTHDLYKVSIDAGQKVAVLR